MTAQQDPYVRVYYRINSDDKFVGLGVAAVGTWVKLLIVADAMHPAAAPIPRWVEEEPLAELVKAGIVDLYPGDSFRIHGLVAEREARSAAAAAAGRERATGAKRSPRGQFQPAASQRPTSGLPASAGTASSDPPADTQPLRSDPILSDPIHSTPSDNARGAVFDVVQLVETLTERTFGYTAGSKVWQMLSDDVGQLGVERVGAAYREVKDKANGSPLDAAGMVYGGHKHLFPIPDGPERMTPAERKRAERDEVLANIRRKHGD